MTERLYYRDSFLYDFEAKVIRLREQSGRVAIVLDRTAFYPTSGGQTFDTGALRAASGAEVQVEEVAETEDGIILHYVSVALVAGVSVHGSIDAARRRDHMQQHSGQHVLSAAFVRLFDMPTVSFHMGDESCTIDLGTKSLSRRQVEQAELLANEVVTEDRPVEVRFVAPEEARALGVRKIPETERDKLRLIDIRDFDLTACGGTHVRSTGQIGAILLRKTENVKQGVRVEFVCGGRAVTTARQDYSALTEAAGALSTHIWELPQQVRKSLDDAKAGARAQQKLLEEVAELAAARLLADAPVENGRKKIVRVIADRELAFVRLLAQKIAGAGEPAVALLASTLGQPALVFAQSPGLPSDMGAEMRKAMAALGGRGGGSRDFAQGGAPDGSRIAAVLHEIAQALR
ncbi:MAG TPA: alanine--tRNA ligase-related protein [Terriglobales bacterium]|nr:alanine--tRNA ligase-related protein [Terriglobales bacterium]